MKVERIHTQHGSHIEPPLDDSWSEIDKLRWDAAVIEHDHGLRLKVEERERGFVVIAPDTGFGSNYLTYQAAWVHMNDLGLGAEMYRRQQATRSES